MIVLWVALLSLPQISLAVPLGNTEVNLTAPIGRDILPGGSSFTDTDIRTSFIFSKLIPFVIKYAIRLGVALCVIALIIGGFRFMTAYGDQEKRTGAQKTIIFAIVGLVITITAFAIVTVITSISFT